MSNSNDEAYALALKSSEANYKDVKSLTVAESLLHDARERYRLSGATHANTADCEYLFNKVQQFKGLQCSHGIATGKHCSECYEALNEF